MSRWTVCLEANATVNVEAETENEAREAAEKTIRAIGIDNLRFTEVSRCYIDISAHKDE